MLKNKELTSLVSALHGIGSERPNSPLLVKGMLVRVVLIILGHHLSDTIRSNNDL
jgi:hypothetical protein